MRLKNKVAVFVGGGSDIALAAGKLFAKEGASILLADYSQPDLERVATEYAGISAAVRTHVADVRNLADMEAAMRCAHEAFGRVDIVVNCAGIILHKPIDEMTPDEWQRVLDVNLTGAFNACKAAVPYMKEQKYGRIVNVASVGGRTGRPGVGVNYAASKAGIIGLTQTLARELAPWNITANAVAPGPLKGRLFLGMAPELIENLEKGIPLGRVGEMDEVAYALLYLASDEASWTTGEVLDVNGGAYI